ncbi:hypothetical protein [Agarilytica rhodophyticola]|uniref:hypothetical protein n=1 Tax=Agarilytica rhodophyticola TaxID=1737490 RepID=UPI000B341892|nr:hypothetical protein [Agarilytica rhodophyticola]
MKKVFLFVFLLGMHGIAHASIQTKKVVRVGCHTHNNTCFAYVEGAITSDSNCPSNDGSFRWSITAPNGESVLSIILAAQMSGKNVSFGEAGCYDNFPTFNYAWINE